MDLLGGYGSSGSDGDGDSGDDSSSASVQSAAGPAPPPPAPERKPKATGGTSTTGAGIGAGGAGGISKKGRRLLSLGAVLPPEIFDRLTREQGGGGGDSSEQSDYDPDDVGGGHGQDDEGGAGGGSSSKKREGLKRQKGASTVAGAGAGAGNEFGAPPPSGEMGDFLRELRSAPTSVGPGGDDGPKKAAAATASRSIEETAPKKPREENLGMAFMSVTTTVRSKKDFGVEDIHAHRPSVGAVASARSNDNMKEPAVAVTAAAAPPIPVPMVSTIRRAVAPPVAVPRPGLSAAPPIQSAVYAPQHQQYQHQNQYQQHLYAQQQQPGAQQSRKKKSRKDLEKSLRAGNFDALGDDERATTFHQDDLDYGGGYVPTEADLSEAAARTAAASAAKRGAAGLRMYDPSAGVDVDVGGEVSQKHRSKHQINQLVAKAAVLEAHRAGGVGPSGQRTVKGSNSRADAKRKYGW